MHEHLQAVRDFDEAAYPIYLQKARFLMTVVMVIIASMSYAVTQISWAIKDTSSTHLVVLIVFASLAALSLVAAFVCGVMCHHIRNTPVVGVNELEKSIRSSTVGCLRPEEVYKDLSENLAKAINDDRAIQKRRAHWAIGLNWTTFAGFLFGAIFISYAIIGNVLVEHRGHDSNQEARLMAVEKEQPSQSPDSPPPPSAERPTLVEPTDYVQSDLTGGLPQAGQVSGVQHDIGDSSQAGASGNASESK
ncbi:MAG: hypothetical protein IH830_03430 [Planctomycetes bacterium]|nr:hypothetical protein [Planctomycetota bacterium]